MPFQQHRSNHIERNDKMKGMNIEEIKKDGHQRTAVECPCLPKRILALLHRRNSSNWEIDWWKISFILVLNGISKHYRVQQRNGFDERFDSFKKWIKSCVWENLIGKFAWRDPKVLKLSKTEMKYGFVPVRVSTGSNRGQRNCKNTVRLTVYFRSDCSHRCFHGKEQ